MLNFFLDINLVTFDYFLNLFHGLFRWEAFFIVANFMVRFVVAYEEYVALQKLLVLFVGDLDLQNAEFYQGEQVNWHINNSSSVCNSIDVVFSAVPVDPVEYVEESVQSQGY